MQQLKNRMAVQGPNKLKLKFCGGGGGDSRLTIRPQTSSSAKSTLHSEVKKSVSYNDPDYDDDVPLSVRLSRMQNLGTPSSNLAVPIKKRHTITTMPLAVKRPFVDNSSLLNKSVKKSKVAVNDHQDKDKDDTPLSRRTEMPVDGSAEKSFSSLKKKFESVKKSIEKCKRKCQEKEKKLQSMARDIEDCERKRQEEEKLESIERVTEKELSCVERNNKTHKKVEEENGEHVTNILVKDAQLGLMDELISERKQELKENETKLRQVMDDIDKVRERKEQCTVELENKERELDAMKKQVDEQAERLKSEKKALLKIMQINKNDQRSQMKEFESRKKQFEEQVKELESEKKQFEEQLKKLRSEEKLLEDQVEGFKSIEDEFEGQVKEFESKEEELKAQMQELRSNEKLLEGQVKEFKSKEDEFEGRIKELDSKEKQLEIREKEVESETKQLEGRIKKFDSKEKQLEIREKELESEKKQLEGRIEEFDSEEKQLKIKVKEIESEKKQFKVKFKELWSKEEEFKAQMQELKRFVSQMEDFKLEGKHFEGQEKELESKDEKLKVHVKEQKSKEKRLEFDEHMKDLESKPNKFDGQLKQPCSSEKQVDALIELFDEEIELVTSDSGNQSSPTSEENDEFELADGDTLVNLQRVSNPSKVVLEIIQHPTIEKFTMGENDVIIGDSHILLLKQLMKLSPHIEPDVREEALKLALHLKANVEENNENSVAALGFLLLLSIYGLVPSFDEDDVLKFFGFVSQHNIAIELFRAMGFADKVSDFVDGLIKRQQYVEAVRFSCAFKLRDNNQLLDLLREHVKNTKLVSESSCNKTYSIEIKDKARDQEIASLETVLQCLSDNNLEFDDLLNEINDRILELWSQKDK